MEVEQIKEQLCIALEAVEDLEEPLKTKAFEVILSKLLESLTLGALPSHAIPKKRKGFVGQVPPIGRVSSCREAIAKLLASEWGSEPRTLGEIRDALKLSAVYYSDQSIANELRRMTKLGILRRLRTRDKKGYAYVSAKPL